MKPEKFSPGLGLVPEFDENSRLKDKVNRRVEIDYSDINMYVVPRCINPFCWIDIAFKRR
jgi:hypothetical protein